MARSLCHVEDLVGARRAIGKCPDDHDQRHRKYDGEGPAEIFEGVRVRNVT